MKRSVCCQSATSHQSGPPTAAQKTFAMTSFLCPGLKAFRAFWMIVWHSRIARPFGGQEQRSHSLFGRIQGGETRLVDLTTDPPFSCRENFCQND